jgi:hypothetical protein
MLYNSTSYGKAEAALISEVAKLEFICKGEAMLYPYSWQQFFAFCHEAKVSHRIARRVIQETAEHAMKHGLSLIDAYNAMRDSGQDSNIV